MNFPKSIEGVVEVAVYKPMGTAQNWVLIEVPHGATRRADYDAVATRLKSQLPAQLEHFFFVNTDVGAPEGAQWLGESLSAQGVGVVFARCLIPRTFIDTNRVVGQTTAGVVVNGMTPAVQGYVTAPEDVEYLTAQHARYHELVKSLYAQVCGKLQGLALQLHSYAPRSVGIEKTDAQIVEALHAAYVPEVYEKWPQRPAIDLISATEDGSFRTSPGLVRDLVKAYAAADLDAKENATYHLHPVTMGYVYAKAYPGQVVCVEMNRGLICAPFTPFGVSPINEAGLERLVSPIGAVLKAALSR